MGGMQLPLGCRFMPTDEELTYGYLRSWASGNPLPWDFVREADVYGVEPWRLPGANDVDKKGKELYFFVRRKKNGEERVGRSAGSGYWIDTGRIKEIYDSRKKCIGFMRTLVFIDKTRNPLPNTKAANWIMHEYTLSRKFEEKALCKIKESNRRTKVSQEVAPHGAEATWPSSSQGLSQPPMGHSHRELPYNHWETFTSASVTLPYASASASVTPDFPPQNQNFVPQQFSDEDLDQYI
ncbi:NAC domain-containing protein 41-like [Tasmannia lanceolata]|uniref:NAC domain-containing protein 41-like n=1 Tax=Tasmannia lanceolata TaxID=3420 RepID=UPI0040648C47